MPNCARSGKKESGLSLFQIDAAENNTQAQILTLYLMLELKCRGYPLHLYVRSDSYLHRKAQENNLPVKLLKSQNGILSSWRLARDMKRYNCKLVHLHDSGSLELGLSAASRAKIPLRIISQRKDTDKHSRLLLRPRTLEDVALIIAVSSKIGRFLREKGINSELIQTIPLGVDYAPFSVLSDKNYLRRELSLTKDDFLVGIMMDIGDSQILQRVVRTAATLNKKTPRVRLILLGEGALHLVPQDQALGFENLMFYLGFRDYFPEALPSLDLLVFPFKVEGFESLIRDALARRLPVVVPRIEGMPEELVHRKTALLLAPQNPASLTNSISQAYENKELVRQLAEKGYETMFEKYSSEAMASRIVSEYERLARRRNISLA